MVFLELRQDDVGSSRVGTEGNKGTSHVALREVRPPLSLTGAPWDSFRVTAVE